MQKSFLEVFLKFEKNLMNAVDAPFPGIPVVIQNSQVCVDSVDPGGTDGCENGVPKQTHAILTCPLHGRPFGDLHLGCCRLHNFQKA